MADPSPYLTIHKKLVAAVQSPDKYASDWKSIAENCRSSCGTMVSVTCRQRSR